MAATVKSRKGNLPVRVSKDNLPDSSTENRKLKTENFSPMPFLTLQNVAKSYGQTAAVVDLSLEVERGEFFGLLGPSGCGKTTTLRMIAGLETPDAGAISFDGRDITGLPPERRGFGMVFQNYALFPHLNVFENVAFGLRARRLPREEIAGRVESALALVRLPGYEKRAVDALSGGQQQRVAIARAVAIEPALLLFDEPLSNLDVSLREETRAELRDLVARLGLTAVYVTHDQEEAFALCDRITVMGEGRELQTGTPRELYERPAHLAVARFLGRNNLIEAVRLSAKHDAEATFKTLTGGHTLRVRVPPDAASAPINRPVTLAVRPERLQLTAGDGAAAENTVRAAVRRINFAGATTIVELDAGGLRLEAHTLRPFSLDIGDACVVTLPAEHVVVLDGDATTPDVATRRRGDAAG